MPGAGAAPAHAAAVATVTKPRAAPAAIAPPAGHLYQPGRAQRTPPPPRTRTSTTGLSCLSCCWSELPAPVTRADAGEAVITTPAKPMTAAQAMPLKVFDAQPR